MRRLQQGPAALAVAGLLLAAGAAEIALPTTFDRVWCRNNKKKLTGDLTISAEGLVLVGKKRTVSIDLDSILMVSLGKMGRDVDTDWAILTVGRPGATRIVGFRDGAKLGYGKRTPEIYEALRAAMKKLSAGPYRVPPGFAAYDAVDHQVVLAVPEDWSPYVQSSVVVNDRALWGTILFSAEPIRLGTGGEDSGLLAVQTGRAPALRLERREATKGMSCEGFTPAARKAILRLAEERLRFARGYEPAQAPLATDVSMGDCAALRVVGRARGPDGVEGVLDLHAVTNGDTLFLLELRSLAESYDERRALLEQAVATWVFAQGKKGRRS